MTGRRASLALLVAACGRIDFDPRQDATTVDAADPSLVMWLPFESDFADVVSGADPTCSGGCPQRVPGRTGMAISYSGAGECLVFADTGATDVPQLTIAMWENKASNGEWAYFSKLYMPATTVFNSWQIEDHMTGQMGFTTHNAGRHDVLYTNDAPPGAWHHLATTFDGTTKKIYVDGALVMASPEPDAIEYDNSQVVVGCDINNGMQVYPYTGMLDDLRVYSRALSDPEIAALAR